MFTGKSSVERIEAYGSTYIEHPLHCPLDFLLEQCLRHVPICKC